MPLRYIPLIFLALTFSFQLTAQNFSGGFNFFLPPDDSTTQLFLPDFPSGEIKDFISIDQEGHFTTNGKPIRFWGVNLTAASCFPLKEKSPFIASRMRKMGINLVRFHHMDNGWSSNEGTIFVRGSGNTRTLDPVALDRLFFLLSEMKKNAVYANINLHVSRTFLEGDGVENADSIWEFGKGVTYFEPHLISLQKEFAQNLLSAENPYTGLALFEDPVIATVEITNENTLYGMWKGDQLKTYPEGGILMKRHANLLDTLWQDFLLKKYGSDAALKQAWGSSDTVTAVNQIEDGSFELADINKHWQIELHENAHAAIQATNETAYSGNSSAKVTVSQVTNTSWHIQFKQEGLSMQKDSGYVLSFYARADRNRSINATLQRDEDPWTWYAGQTYQLTTDWKQYRLSINSPEDNLGHLRVTFNFGNETGPVWFDDIVFSKPKSTALEIGEGLSNRNIKRADYSQRLYYSDARVADQAQFYLQIQRSYYQDMYAFLKNEIGVQVPITGTNALVGPSDVFTMQDLDYIDDHAYWNHPRFPNAAWSTTDWYIDNNSMLEQQNMGTMSQLYGGLAIAGKPYTISEYNHPFPNRYHWEMIPIIASYASYHDADGLMFFSYNDGTDTNWEMDFIDGFFSIHRNNSLMSLSPVFAHAYRNYLIESSQNKYLVNYDSNYIFNLSVSDNFGRWGKYFPYNQMSSVSSSIRTQSFNADKTDIPEMGVPTGTQYTTPNGQLIWNSNARLQVIDAPRIQSMTGNLSQQNDLQLAHLTLKKASDEGVITWLSLGDEDLPGATHSLLSINSRIQNSGMIWDGNTTVQNQWGDAPTHIMPIVVSLSLDLDADSIRVFPLDETGREQNYFTLYPSEDEKFDVEIDQSMYQTPWFGIRAFLKSTPVKELDPQNRLQATLLPNPATDQTILEYETKTAAPLLIQLYDWQGKLIRSWERPGFLSNKHQILLPLDQLPTGIYLVQLLSGQNHWQGKLIKN
ncbi:MAG: carbohydrate binding domain-containing protein [Saprospiraceae bacterium]|nr:carbohydrate binding domain-containing protein [Saprospiraceae bacterium]